MNRIKEAVAAASMVSLLASGCSGAEPDGREFSQPVPEATTSPLETSPTEPSLAYGLEGVVSWTASDCWFNPRSWAVGIDNNPTQAEPNPSFVGMYKRSVEPSEKSIGDFAAGLTFEALGNYRYHIVTSNNPTQPIDVNLQAEPYQQLLEVVDEPGSNYLVQAEGHIGRTDGYVYFTLNCLPEFDFHGEVKSVPLTPDIQVPPTIEQPAVTLPQNGESA